MGCVLFEEILFHVGRADLADIEALIQRAYQMCKVVENTAIAIFYRYLDSDNLEGKGTWT